MKPQVTQYYSGPSGLLLPVRNKLFFPQEYKEKSRLCFYSSLMNSIEINSSFYKVPMASTVQKWTDEVPDDFRFTFKMFREITHNKALAFDPMTVKKFMEVVSAAGDKKACLLVQLPGSVRTGNLRQLALLLEVLRDNDPDKSWNIAIEFRHISMYNEEAYHLLENFEMAMVIQDKPPVTPLLDWDLPFVYLRFHGPVGSYRGTFQNDILVEYASYLREWRTEGKTVYTYFNNTMGSAINNLFTLRDYVMDYSLLF